MTPRKPRASFGSSSGPQGSHKNLSTSLDAFEDFRKRHSRQNKEIIIENALRRTTIKGLQEEIAALQIEVMEIRQVNRKLSAEVSSLRKGKTGLRAESRDALQRILDAVPYLQSLKDELEFGVEGEGSPTTASSWAFGVKENPSATRPAAMGAAGMALVSLTEDEEAEEEDDMDRRYDAVSERSNPKSRRRTDVGSVASRPAASEAREHPVQLARSPDSTLSKITPPELAASPRIKSTSSEKRIRRRRESGLQIPELDTPTVDDHRKPASLEQSPKAKLVDDAVRSRVRRKDVEIAERDLPGMSAGQAEADWADVQDGGFDDQKTWSAPPDVVDTDNRGTSSSQGCTDIVVLTDHPEDDGSRGRRSKKSVNYKEPSLTNERKMRKPDGISAEEALRGNIGRAQSVGPPKPLDEMQLNDADHQTKPVPSPSKTSRLLQDHKVGVRRKSILPKGGGRTFVVPTEPDDTPGTPAVVSASQEVALASGSIAGGGEVAESAVDEAPKSTTSSGRRELPRDMAHHFPKTTSLSHTSQASTTRPQERSRPISGSTKVKTSSSSSCSADPSRAVPVVKVAESSAKPVSEASSRGAEAMPAAFRRTGLEPGLSTTATKVQTIRREPRKTVA